MLQTSLGQCSEKVFSEERAPAGSQGSPNDEPVEIATVRNNDKTKLSNFEEIYHKSNLKAHSGVAEWNVLKVADMLNSEHLRGLSSSSKHSALLMALEAAGVAVEDILQDAVHRQRLLNDYDEAQQQRLQQLEAVKLGENERLAAEMEALCVQYRSRIGNGVNEIERERETLREWQAEKEREQRRIAEAASACVSSDPATSSEASVTRLLEKNAGVTRYRESA
jgi:hypothetical protein